MLTPVMNRKNLSVALPWLAFASLALILPVAFLYEKGGRVLFYYCSYFSLAGIAYEIWHKNKIQFANKKALSMLLLGVVYIAWSLIVQYVTHEKTGLYYTEGKRFILAFIIILYSFHVFRSGYIERNTIIRLSMLSLALAFVTSSSFAIFQAVTSVDRVVLGINRATMTAYAYSAVSLGLIAFILQSPESKQKKFYFLSVAIISLYVVMLTQTRSAMVIHTLFLVAMTFRLFSVTRNIKFISCVAVLMLIAAGLSYKVIDARMETTITEYHDYQQGNDKTSLGSRFTMWKMGVLAFENAPLGQSQDARNQFITAYLDTHHQADSWALIYISVHLHNEFIQFASLFGILGVLVLLYFFYTFIVAEYRTYRTVTPIAIVGLAILLYGMTDVLLSSVEFIAIFCVLVVILSVLEYKKD